MRISIGTYTNTGSESKKEPMNIKVAIKPRIKFDLL